MYIWLTMASATYASPCLIGRNMICKLIIRRIVVIIIMIIVIIIVTLIKNNN